MGPCSEVPSGFFVTDALLYADQLLDGKFLKKPGESKVVFAGKESVKIKALIGSLRYLWRSSRLNSLVSLFPKLAALIGSDFVSMRSYWPASPCHGAEKPPGDQPSSCSCTSASATCTTGCSAGRRRNPTARNQVWGLIT